jgi:hypothetical protein
LGKKRDRNQVFWLEIDDDYDCPAFQVGPSGLLPGIRKVLEAFQEEDPWARVTFMLPVTPVSAGTGP